MRDKKVGKIVINLQDIINADVVLYDNSDNIVREFKSTKYTKLNLVEIVIKTNEQLKRASIEEAQPKLEF